MDSPGIYPTDIMSIVNDAWDHSFSLVVSNQKAIADRGWGPLNYALLDNDDIKCTMTDSEKCQYHEMLKGNSSNGHVTLSELSSKAIQQSSSLLTASSISESTNNEDIPHSNKSLNMKNEMKYDPRYLSKVLPNSVMTMNNIDLNFSVGRSADIARRLLHDSDLREAREANQKLANKGKQARNKLDAAKKLTAMLNFNNIGCRVGEDSLKLRLDMARKKKEIDDAIQHKKDKMTNERKRKYDEIQNELKNGLPEHELSITQLKALCLHKKKKDDKVSISKLKRNKLVSLWLSWKSRYDPVDISIETGTSNILRTKTSEVEVNCDTGVCQDVDDNEHTFFGNSVLS